VLGSKATGRVGMPALLLFLALGMLAGSDGPEGIAFDDPRLAQSLGVMALTFILCCSGCCHRQLQHPHRSALG
jgi:cell volume regulation protein A